MHREDVLRDVAARIIQHHFRALMQRRKEAAHHNHRIGSVGAGAASPRRRPTTPSAVHPASYGSVLDFMPKGRLPQPDASGRPHSRPPRPRATATRSATATQPHAREQRQHHHQQHKASPNASPKALPLEDSAERMNRTKSDAAAAAPSPGLAAETVVTDDASKATAEPAAELPLARFASPPLPLEIEQDQQRRRQPGSATSVEAQLDVRASASTAKMGHILRLIEQLEKQAVEEARQVAPGLPRGLPVGAAPQSMAAAAATVPAAERLPVHPMARVLAAQPLSTCSKQMLAAAATDDTAAKAARFATASRVAHKAALLLHTPAPEPGKQGGETGHAAQWALPTKGPEAPAAAEHWELPQAGVGAQAGTTALARTQPEQQKIDAVAVASSVRAKIQQLQAAVAEKDGQLAALQRNFSALQAQQEAAMQAAEDGHRVRLAPWLILPKPEDGTWPEYGRHVLGWVIEVHAAMLSLPRVSLCRRRWPRRRQKPRPLPAATCSSSTA